jgi:hypothetical protein
MKGLTSRGYACSPSDSGIRSGFSSAYSRPFQVSVHFPAARTFSDQSTWGYATAKTNPSPSGYALNGVTYSRPLRRPTWCSAARLKYRLPGRVPAPHPGPGGAGNPSTANRDGPDAVAGAPTRYRHPPSGRRSAHRQSPPNRRRRRRRVPGDRHEKCGSTRCEADSSHP